MTWTWTSGEAARLWRILGDGDCLLLDLTAENHRGYDPLPGQIPGLLDHLASTSAAADLLAWQGIRAWVDQRTGRCLIPLDKPITKKRKSNFKITTV